MSDQKPQVAYLENESTLELLGWQKGEGFTIGHVAP